MPKLIYLGKVKPSVSNSLTVINFLGKYNYLITLIV